MFFFALPYIQAGRLVMSVVDGVLEVLCDLVVRFVLFEGLGEGAFDPVKGTGSSA